LLWKYAIALSGKVFNAFNSFPVAVRLLASCSASCFMISFNSFPVAVKKPSASGSAGPGSLSILSQLLSARLLSRIRHALDTFNSFPVAVWQVQIDWLETEYNFQFFPSCCRGGGARLDAKAAPRFQFFPSCCRRRPLRLADQVEDFQFFPSCCSARAARRTVRRYRELSILSQLLS